MDREQVSKVDRVAAAAITLGIVAGRQHLHDLTPRTTATAD